MARSKVAISLDESILNRLDQLVKKQIFPNRSQAIEEALVHEKAHFGDGEIRTAQDEADSAYELLVALHNQLSPKND